MKAEVAEGNDRSNPMKDSCGLYPAQEPGQELGPIHMSKLQHHSGYGQKEEADNYKDMGNTLVAREAPDVFVPNFFRLFFPFLPPFGDRTWQPHQQV